MTSQVRPVLTSNTFEPLTGLADRKINSRGLAFGMTVVVLATTIVVASVVTRDVYVAGVATSTGQGGINVTFPSSVRSHVHLGDSVTIEGQRLPIAWVDDAGSDVKAVLLDNGTNPSGVATVRAGKRSLIANIWHALHHQ